MADNQEGRMIEVVQAFHTKMDTGFARLHDRIDKSDEKRESFEKQVVGQIIELEFNQAHAIEPVIPTQPCPDMIALKKEKEEAVKAKAEVVRTGKLEVVKLAIKAVGMSLLAWLGFEKWLGG